MTPTTTTTQRAFAAPAPPGMPSRLLAPGIARVVAAIAALVIVSVCGFNSAARIGQPFPGFFVWENLFVPAIGASSWSGVESGLRYHSWLLSADRVPLADAADLQRVLAGKRAGDSVTYEAEHQGQRYTVQVPVRTFGLREYFESTGIYLLDALALMTLAVIMLYLKPRGGDAGSLFAFATMLSLYLATAIDLFGPYYFRELYFFFAGCAPTTALVVLSFFPVGRVRRRWETPALLLALGVSLAFGIASNFVFFRDRSALLLLDRLFHVYLAASILTALGFFAWHFATARDQAVRQRTKVVLLASLGAFLPAVAVFALYAGLAAIPFNVLTVFFVIFPVGIGYAIAKHDLFDIDRLIKRALAYVILSAAVLGAYGLTITVLELLFANLTGVAERLTSGLVVLALLLLLNPSRDRVQGFVDRLYDRRRYEYRDVVRSVSRRFSSILDFEALVRTALELIDETVQPVSAEIFTVAADGSVTRRGLLIHDAGGNGRLLVRDDPAPELAEAVDAMRGSDLLTTGIASSPAAEPAVAAVLPELSAVERVLATSMRLEGRLTGFLAVGRKRAGGYHTADDAELLRTMSDQLAVALENAHAYQTIGLLNLDLAAKAQALTQANRELHEAQDQLIRSERLAAIGELSGAVAHAMRNPLAAIKMAAEFGGMEFENHAAAENFRDISSEAGRLEKRIRDLLDFSRPFEPHPELVDFDQMIARAVDVSRARASQKRVQLVFEGDGAGTARLDPTLFEQVIVELVANAIDASPEDGRVIVRSGRASSNGTSSAWVEVADNGPGIPEDKRARIFDLFFTTKKQGTGFGLATVKKIVERHSGSVAVDTAMGRGTTFTVTVPAA
ncbi:MAG TPA: GAF domain-containing sensor histidine kinase [Candidatus Limnocylindrales bacterium]|nr:GAF domain-containing sensor histidine kinase [Candidatus Limnocylindrales bacterium]